MMAREEKLVKLYVMYRSLDKVSLSQGMALMSKRGKNHIYNGAQQDVEKLVYIMVGMSSARTTMPYT